MALLLRLISAAATPDAVRRTTVKAICEDGDGLLMMLTPATGDVKFPGGGVRPGEGYHAALRRELMEETGRPAHTIGRHVLTVIERRPAREDASSVFEMVSHYYRVEAGPQTAAPTLDPYEEALDLTPIRIPTATALITNDRSAPWFAREQAVLGLIASRLV